MYQRLEKKLELNGKFYDENWQSKLEIGFGKSGVVNNNEACRDTQWKHKHWRIG